MQVGFPAFTHGLPEVGIRFAKGDLDYLRTTRREDSFRQSFAVDRGSGFGPSPETLAKLTPEGRVLVLEGKHRLNAVVIDNALVPESIPGKPYWLEFQYSPIRSTHSASLKGSSS